MAPIGKTLDVLDPHSGERMAEQFTRWTFLGNQKHPERIRLDIDHRNRYARKCVGLHAIGGWWVGRFRVNHTLIGALAEDKSTSAAPSASGSTRSSNFRWDSPTYASTKWHP